MDDSFDLFGGLPTVGGGGGDNSEPAKTIEASQTKDTTTTITSTKNTDNQPSNTKPATSTTDDGVVKSEALSDKPKESASSLVSSIGTSGTKLVSLCIYDMFELFIKLYVKWYMRSTLTDNCNCNCYI